MVKPSGCKIRVHAYIVNATTFKKKLSDDGIADKTTENLGFQTKAGLEYGFKDRPDFVHFDLCLFETLFLSVDVCITVWKRGSN